MKYVLALLLLIAPASAYIQIGQGDQVYMNETVDISQAVSWPAFQICWCSQRNYDCDPPDQVIDIEGNMYDYYINPQVFKYGTYYRWDGEWHRGENSVAFTVLPGKRVSAVPTSNPAIVDSEDTPIPAAKEGPYNYIIARGDSPLLYTTILPEANAEPSPAHLWLFSNTLQTMNLPMERNGNTYSYKMTKELTANMAEGTYTGYIQLNGLNRVQDIFLDGTVLDTPYDDTVVPDVNILQWNLRSVKEDFDTLRTKCNLFDDELIPVSIEVAPMSITITNVEQTEDKLYISGETTLDNETVFTLQLDPDNYKLRSDILLHTWQSYATGGIDARREFSTAVDIDAKELYIGAHEIIMSVNKDGYTTETSYDFKVTDVYVMPTPTPELKRFVVGGDYEGINYRAMPTIEPTPVIEPTFDESVLNVVITPTPMPTTIITPTPAIVTQPPVAKDTIPTIPLDIGVVVGAGVASILLRRIS